MIVWTFAVSSCEAAIQHRRGIATDTSRRRRLWLPVERHNEPLQCSGSLLYPIRHAY